MNRPDIAKIINGMAQHRNVHPRNFMKIVNYVSELEFELEKLQKAEHNTAYKKSCKQCFYYDRCLTDGTVCEKWRNAFTTA